MYASPSDNYWLVGDQDPVARWSSDRVIYIDSTSDSVYLAWLAAGYETSEIATEQELADLLNATYPAGSPIPVVPVPVPGTGPGPIFQQLIQAPVTVGAVGTFTVPAGVQRLVIWGQAAGGGGQSIANTGSVQLSRQAGGPGETRRMILDVTPGDVLTYSIGAEGAGGAAAPAGSANPGGTGADLTIGTSATTYPVVADIAVADSASATVANVPVPVSAAGDLLLLFIRCGNSGITSPAGWTQIHNGIRGTSPRAYLGYKIAGASEPTTVSVTTGVATVRQSICYRITGHDPAVPPEYANAAGTSNAPNPPSLTPSWGSKRSLWLAAAYCNNPNGTAMPSNYHNFQQNLAGFGWLKTAQRELQASTDNPSAFNCLNDDWIALTVAVKPLGVPSMFVCKGGVGGNAADTPPAGVPAGGVGGMVIQPTNPGQGWSNNGISCSIGGSTIFGQASPTFAVGARLGSQGGPGSGGGGGCHSTATAVAGGAGGVGLILFEGYGASSA